MRRRAAILAAPLALLLAAPSSAFALNINENYHPQNEFKLDSYLNLPGPLDINKGVIYIWLAALITCVLMVVVARSMQRRPNRLQTLVESAYLFTRDNLTRGNMPPRDAATWFPFIATIFLFIEVSNLIGYLPLPMNTEEHFHVFGLSIPIFALYAATANISVPLVLTIMVWLAYHTVGIRRKGPIKYFKSWIPSGVEGFARIPIFAIEVISHFVRLVSLSVRLFANLLAGHLLILFMGGGLVVLLNLAVLGSVVLGVVTGAAAVAFFLFEVGLVATLQAFIFAILTAIYIGGAVAEEH